MPKLHILTLYSFAVLILQVFSQLLQQELYVYTLDTIRNGSLGNILKFVRIDNLLAYNIVSDDLIYKYQVRFHPTAKAHGDSRSHFR